MQHHAESVRGARAAMRAAGFTVEDLKSMPRHEQLAAARAIMAQRDHRDRMRKQRSKREQREDRREREASLRRMKAERNVVAEDAMADRAFEALIRQLTSD